MENVQTSETGVTQKVAPLAKCAHHGAPAPSPRMNNIAATIVRRRPTDTNKAEGANALRPPGVQGVRGRRGVLNVTRSRKMPHRTEPIGRRAQSGARRGDGLDDERIDEALRPRVRGR